LVKLDKPAPGRSTRQAIDRQLGEAVAGLDHQLVGAPGGPGQGSCRGGRALCRRARPRLAELPRLWGIPSCR